MSVIRERRRELGLTQGDLAARMGVTVSAVSQYERGEDTGSATLATIRAALSAMGEKSRVVRVPDLPWLPVVLDPRVFDSIPHRTRANRERAVFRARSRIRSAAIAGEAALAGVSLPIDDIWLICDRLTVTASLAEVHRVRAVRDAYDCTVRQVQRGSFRAAIDVPDGRIITPDVSITNPVVRAVQMAATAIRNGASDLAARLAMNGSLIDNGYGWIMFHGRDRAFYREAADALTARGDGRPFASLMAARYSEDD